MEHFQKLRSKEERTVLLLAQQLGHAKLIHFCALLRAEQRFRFHLRREYIIFLLMCTLKDGFQPRSLFRIAAECDTLDGFIDRVFAQGGGIDKPPSVRNIALMQFEDTELKLQFCFLLSVGNAV